MLVVAQELVHRQQVLDQAADLGERRAAGERHVEHAARDRRRRRHDLLLPGKDALQPPAGDVGERQQAQRLAGRRAVDDDHVPVARLVVALELQEAEELVGARGDGELLGRDAVDALAHEQVAEPVLHRRPVAFHLVLGGDLLAEEVRIDAGGLAFERRLERVGERVRRVRRHHQRAGARGGAAARGARGDRRLAYPAFTGVEDRARRHASGVILGGAIPYTRW